MASVKRLFKVESFGDKSETTSYTLLFYFNGFLTSSLSRFKSFNKFYVEILLTKSARLLSESTGFGEDVFMKDLSPPSMVNNSFSFSWSLRACLTEKALTLGISLVSETAITGWATGIFASG